MAANMLAAYYGKGYDAHELFGDLAIAEDPSYEQHINKYNVIFVNIKSFWLRAKTAEALTALITQRIVGELRDAYPELAFSTPDDLAWTLCDIYRSTGEQFIFIVDEWDCLVRESPQNIELSRAYLHFLEDLFKDQPYVALVYITGILPVKKYGSQSALNMFREFTMLSAGELAQFVGFTEDEVKSLCERYRMDFAEAQRWYDGYLINGLHVYNPQAIVMAMYERYFRNYWTKTETFESLQAWIASDFKGLRRDIIAMLNGYRCLVNVSKFGNSFGDIRSRDDVLALLVHIGYLGYIEETRQVYIPNLEIAGEFVNAIESCDESAPYQHLQNSKKRL